MSEPKTPECWNQSERGLWVLALTVISILKTGYCVFYDNHATQLPLVYRLQDPDLFPGDPFLGAMEGYMGWVWWLVAKVSELVDLELVLAVLFLVTRALLIYSAVRLGSIFAPKSKAAPLMAGLLMALGPYPILADGTLVEVYWEQSSMFMPLFVLGLALMLERKPVRFFLLFGVAYLVNPLYGSWAAAFFAITYLSDPERGPWKRFALASPLAIALITPVFLGGVGVLSQETVDMDLWMWVNRLLISPHAFPETWVPVVFWHFLLFSVLVLVSGRMLSRRGSRLGRLTISWTILAWTCLALAFLAATGVSRALLVFQPARASELFYLAGGIAVAAVGACLAEKSSGGVGLLTLVVSFSSLAYLLVPEFRDFAMGSAFLVGAVLALRLLWIEKATGRSSRVWITLTCVWLLFATGLTVSGSVMRRTKREGSLARAMYRRPEADMAALAAWAKENTSVDSIFFHDPVNWEWGQFRYLAERPVFGTWKDASAVLWDPAYAEEWTARFAAFGFRDYLRDRWDLSRPGEVKRVRRSLMRRYVALSDEHIDAISQDYRIDFWIAPVATSSGFPEVTRAGEFKILDVR